MVWGRSAEGCSDLAARLAANDPKLTSLTILRFRRFNEQDVAELAEALAGNRTLTELICASHAISAAAAAKLGDALASNSSLVHACIGDSSFGDAALDALVQGGLAANTSLLRWDLEHKGLTQGCAGSVARVLQQHPSLQQLSLSRNAALGDAGLQQLCSCSWAALSRLELSRCGITHEGLGALAAAPSLHQLQQLELSHNALGAGAAAALQQLLERGGGLQVLQLAGTQLADAGVAGLAAALPAAAALRTLDLSDVALGRDGAAALAAAVRQLTGTTSSRLQRLVLAGNRGLDDAAICQLAAAFSDAAAAAAPHAGAAAGAAAGVAAGQADGLELDLALTGIGADALAALSHLHGLRHLSLFGCQRLGGDSPAAWEALLAGVACAGGFPALLELSLTGCGLGLQRLSALMRAIAAGGLPALTTLELGANSGVTEAGFEAGIAALRAARPGLDVHWRMADGDEGPPPGVQAQQ